MKTTVDLPDEILHRAKIIAAERRTSLKALILAGLDQVLRSMTQAPEAQAAALDRLHKGLQLAGKPLTRDQAHERHPVS
ncbi:MAG: hypothetical protein ABSA83_14075 [Verrucomicrobiota bacterium]